MLSDEIYSKDSEESQRINYSSDSYAYAKEEKNRVLSDNQIQRYVKLSWEDINYYVSTKKETIHILKHVSGHANPGEFLAIMGASGSGKTTLLNILANRVRSGNNIQINGTITANGKDSKEINISKYAAYVMQDDILLPSLTPRDCLMFYAKLRCSGTDKERLEKVENIMNDLNIAGIADNQIGNEIIKGISGGEKKRVCIGIEFMSDPCIIMLDEPTSGLDSFNAGVIIDLLLKQADKGKTIISTIHQPSSNVFKKFDKLMLLSEGNVVYHGPCKKSRKYFAELGYKCPRQVNPADYYMRILHITNRFEMTDEERNMLDLLTKSYKENNSKETESKYELSQLHEIETYHPGYLVEFFELLKRSAKTSIKNRVYLKLRLLMDLSIGVLMALVYNDLGNGEKAIQNINGVLFMLAIWCVMRDMQSVIMNCNIYLDLQERACFLKEHDEGLYGASSYFLSKNIIDLPWTLVSGILSSVIIYFSLGLNLHDGSKFVIFYCIFVMSLQLGMGFGYITGVLFSTVESAMAFSSIILTPLTAFGGEDVKINSIPLAWRWITYITPFKWVFQAFTVNEYTDWEKDCDTGCDPLGDLGWSDQQWEGIIGLIVLSTCIRLIAFFILKLSTHKKVS